MEKVGIPNEGRSLARREEEGRWERKEIGKRVGIPNEGIRRR